MREECWFKKTNPNVHICSSGKSRSIVVPMWMSRRAMAVLVSQSCTSGFSSDPECVYSGRAGLLKFTWFSTSSQLEAAVPSSTNPLSKFLMKVGTGWAGTRRHHVSLMAEWFSGLYPEAGKDWSWPLTTDRLTAINSLAVTVFRNYQWSSHCWLNLMTEVWMKRKKRKR